MTLPFFVLALNFYFLVDQHLWPHFSRPNISRMKHDRKKQWSVQLCALCLHKFRDSQLEGGIFLLVLLDSLKGWLRLTLLNPMKSLGRYQSQEWGEPLYTRSRRIRGSYTFQKWISLWDARHLSVILTACLLPRAAHGFLPLFLVFPLGVDQWKPMDVPRRLQSSQDYLQWALPLLAPQKVLQVFCQIDLWTASLLSAPPPTQW